MYKYSRNRLGGGVRMYGMFRNKKEVAHGGIYKMKIDAYNSYYQQMRLLGKVNEARSFDEREKKECKWLK